ncbi:hypothetical protein, partial [Sphingobacterium lactis]|uniref:hypothetical protein n=1 Tax=Sphingobacterium lactis TaxID=797291 RepID=UPI001F479F60
MGNRNGSEGRPWAPEVRRKRAPENYFKINFGESKKPLTFAVPTTGNGTGRDARSRKTMTDQDPSG